MNRIFQQTLTTISTEQRPFGVEIEFKSPLTREQIAAELSAAGIDAQAEGYNHRTASHWKLVYDASVQNGHELVSPPMAFNAESFAEIETVCRVLAAIGARVDRQCGLHVHHDAAGLSDREIVKAVATYVKYEAHIDQIMPMSRRGQNNSMLKSLYVMGSPKATIQAVNRCKSRQDLVNLYRDRYYKVNVHSLSRHGTLEIRHHSGTIEAAKIVNWVKLTRYMLVWSRQVASVQIRNEDRLDVKHFETSIIGNDLAQYTRARRAQLN